MSLSTVVAIGTAGYFAVFGAGFLFRPQLCDRLGLRWTNEAGKTEIRCYYGAVSWALAAFLLHLVASDQVPTALTAALFLASAVLTVRVIGLFADGGRTDPYVRVAVPTETAFVAVLALARFLA